MIVSVYRLSEKGKRRRIRIISGRIKPDETKEVRLFGIKGEDV